MRYLAKWKRGQGAWLYLAALWMGSQCASAMMPARAPRYSSEAWTTSQGLPQNSVLSLCRTRDGFLWVGTLGGLAQFDGARFRVFRSLDGSSIADDAVKYLVQDAGGALWIGSSTAVTRYRDGVFERFDAGSKEGHAFMAEGIVALEADARGGVWMANHRGQVLLVRDGQSRVVSAPAVVTALAADPAGGVWAASRNGFFLLRDGAVASRVWAAGSSFAAIYAGARDGSGRGEVVARAGLDTYALRGNALTRWAGFRRTWHAAADGDGGSLWLTAETGLLLIKDGVVVRQVGVKDGLAEGDIEAVLGDGAGGVWAGAYTSGLQHLYNGAFASYDARDGLPDAPYDMVSAAPDGAVWVGGSVNDTDSDSGSDAAKKADKDASHAPRVIGRMDADGIMSFGWAEGVTGEQAMGIAFDDRHGMVLAMAPSGLFRFAGGRFVQFYRPAQGRYATALMKDHAGNLWLGVHGGALHELLAAGGERVLTEREGLLDNSIWSLAEDKAGTVWVTSSKGVTALRGDSGTERFPLGFIGSAYADPRGGVWFGSFKGLRYYDGKGFHLLTQKDGLPSDTVICMARDAEGNLWAGSANGIFRLEAGELDRWMHGEPMRLHVRVFGSADGLLSSEVIDVGQNTLSVAPDHRLWFATTRGISVIDPSLLRDEPLVASIEQVSVDGERQSGAGSFEVRPGRHTIRIEYTAPHLVDAGRVVFDYKLDGWDRDWVSAGTSREVSYAGLPPGSYSFHVRARYGDASGAASIAGMSLAVQPFFYQTRWFVLLLAAAGAGVLWLLLRLRVRASEQRLEAMYKVRLDERNRIARQLHDTLIQDVVATALGLEALSGQMNAQHGDRQNLEKQEIDAAVASLQGTVRRGRSALIELRNEEAAMVDLAAALTRARGELWSGDVPEFVLRVSGNAPAFLASVYDDVYSIAREALINAYRHGHAARIEVKIAYSAGSVELTVEDDGMGLPGEFTAQGRPGHFGLQTMRERSVKIGGRLTMDAADGEGTRVRLVVMRERARWWNPWQRRLA